MTPQQMNTIPFSSSKGSINCLVYIFLAHILSIVLLLLFLPVPTHRQ